MRLSQISIVLFANVLVYSCSERQKKSDFDNLYCATDFINPEYDAQIVQITNPKTGMTKDTIIKKIPKERKIFKPCLIYYYTAKYRNKYNDILSNDSIAMMATGNRWEFDEHMQDEILLGYDFERKTEKSITRYQIDYPNFGPWQIQNRTGIIENREEIWMHPFRDNQYKFTEVAPFPCVKLPLTINKSWTSSLSIHDGWGKWSNSSGRMEYTVKSMDKLIVPFLDERIECYKIESVANFRFGKSKNTFWFSYKYGFIKMFYEMYDGDTLEIVLVDLRNSSI